MNNTDYQNYQLQWMQDHAHSLEDLIMSLEKYRNGRFGLTLPELFHEWEQDQGFNSEIWACEDEFEDCEMQKNQKQYVNILSTYFGCNSDLSKYTDSMLFDSDTETIAEGYFETDNAQEKIQIELCVRGAVRVEADGKIFTSPSEFPAWLKERIRKHPHGWQHLETDNREVYCHEYNWFELLVTSESGYCNGYVYERDLSKNNPEDVYRAMLEIARDYFTA